MLSFITSQCEGPRHLHGWVNRSGKKSISFVPEWKFKERSLSSGSNPVMHFKRRSHGLPWRWVVALTWKRARVEPLTLVARDGAMIITPFSNTRYVPRDVVSADRL